MPNYATLKSAIQQVIKTNGNNEITGASLQQSLLAMINSLGAGYQFVGIATPSTNPGTPDQKLFYIAETPGVYGGFGGITIKPGEIALLAYTTGWSKISKSLINSDSLNMANALGVTPVQYAGMFVGAGNTVIVSTSAYNGSILYLPKGQTAFSFQYTPNAILSDLAYSAYGFTNYPTIGSVATTARFTRTKNDNIVSFSIAENENGMFVLVTLRLTGGDTNENLYFVSKAKTDLQKAVADIMASIPDLSDYDAMKQALAKKTAIDLTQYSEPGKIRSYQDTLYTGSGVFNTARIPVNPGEKYFVTCYAVNSQYFGAFVQRSNYSLAGPLLTGTGVGYTRALVTIPDNVAYLVLNTINANYPLSALKVDETFVDAGLLEAVVDGNTAGIAELKSYLMDSAIKTTSGSIAIGGRLDKSIYSANFDGKTTIKFRLDIDTPEFSDYGLFVWAESTLMVQIPCVPNKYQTYTLPAGFTRVQIFKSFTATIAKTYTFEWFYPSELTQRLEAIINLIPTDTIIEDGSNLTQDQINGIATHINPLPVSKTTAPVVAFVYDDVFSEQLVTLFNARGLKATFALIGNVDKTNQLWKTTANKVRAIQVQGHGTCAHGVVGGVTVTGSGIDQMNDADAHTAIRGENGAFDDFKLSHKGLVYFNTWSNNPRTWAVIGKYYDYALGFGEPINTPGETDLYELGRFNTDDNTMLAPAKAYVDQAIEKGNCLLVFGGHFPSRTGSGTGSYSTMEQFTELLDYIAEKINDNQMISLNLDDAVKLVWSRGCAASVIQKHDFRYCAPIVGQTKIDNGLKYCSDAGAKAIYSIAISGTPVTGSVTLKLNGVSKTTDTSTAQSITISTTAGQSISDVIATIVGKIYTGYIVRKTGNTTIGLYRPINGETFTPFVENNTTGLVFSITQVIAGAAETWQ